MKATDTNEKGQSIFMDEELAKMSNKKRMGAKKNTNIKIIQKRQNASILS